MRPPLAPRLLVALVVVGLLAACSEPPTAPTPTPAAPPPVVPAPVISSLSAAVTRAEAGEDVAITARIEDAAPTLGTVTYQWSANVGRVTGSGAAAVWRLDKGVITTGVDVAVTLTIVKPYQVLENGQLVSREHRVTRQAAPFRTHDSVAEISRIVRTFLVDYFGKFEVSPDACLVDFSNSCPGKAAERRDIVDNRARTDLRIVSAEARVESVEINGDRTFAWIVAPCTFRDVRRSDGRELVQTGDCLLTAVYEQGRWWLCDSNYRSRATSTSRAPSTLQPRGMRYWE